MPHTTSLTADQHQAYAESGYLVLPDVLGADDLHRLRTEADRLAELVVDCSLALGEPSARLDAQLRDGEVVLRKIQPVGDLSEAFAALADDPRLTGPLADLLGCPPALMEEKLNYKQILPGNPPVGADTGSEAFPFHTDWAYFYLDGYPRDTLSVAVAIDDTTVTNGCLRMVPGSHLRDWPLQSEWPPILVPDAVDPAAAVDVELPAGSAVLFNCALVHASQENRTADPRRLLILSYFPSTHAIAPDQRNRALREAGRVSEARYRAMVAAGTWTPTYRLGR